MRIIGVLLTLAALFLVCAEVVMSRKNQQLGEATWAKMPKINSELFSLTYGAMISQVSQYFSYSHHYYHHSRVESSNNSHTLILQCNLCVLQLVKDLEDVDVINAKLEKM